MKVGIIRCQQTEDLCPGNDAPYRETAPQIERHRRAGVLTVEMEAAALMALSQVRSCEIASLLHSPMPWRPRKGIFTRGLAMFTKK